MPVQPTDLFLANRNNVSYRTTGLEIANYVNDGVSLDSLGIPNHDQVTVDASGNTSTSGTITGSNLTASEIALGNIKIIASGTTIIFQVNGVNVAKIDASGNLTTKANVTAYGSV